MRTLVVALAILAIVGAAGVLTARLRKGVLASSRRRRSLATAEEAIRSGKLQGIADSLARTMVTARLEDLHAQGRARVMRVSPGHPARVGLSDGEIWHCYGGDLDGYRQACERNPDACAAGRIRLEQPPAVGSLVETTLRPDDRHEAEH